MSISRIAWILACAAAAAQQAPPPAKGQERDLKIEKLETPATPAPALPKVVTVPRSYAVIVGIEL